MPFTIDEIRNFSPQKIGKMDREELENLLQGVSRQVNRRLDRIEKAGLTEMSPAARYIKREGSRMTTAHRDMKNMSEDELRKEISKGRGFLSQDRKTTTVSGIREYVKRQDEIIGQGKKLPPNFNKTEFWRRVDEIRDRTQTRGLSSSRLINIVSENMDKPLPDNLQEWIDEQYEQMQEEFNERYSPADFFEF